MRLRNGIAAGAIAIAVVADHAGAETSRQAPNTESAPARATYVYSTGSPTWIFADPVRTRNAIGYLRQGQSLPLRDREVRSGPGCGGGFVAVEPFGFVCLDHAASLDGTARYIRSMRELAPRPGPLPFHYALSNGTPMYRRLPSPEEWRHEERFYDPPGTFQPLSWGNRGHERLAEPRSIPPRAPVPSFLADGGSVARRQARSLVHREIPLGSMLAYTKAFEHGGRTWLQSADGTVVPADRVRPFRTTTFHGVELRDGLTLPLAWMRQRPRPQYVRDGDQFKPTGRQWSRQSFVALDDQHEPREYAGVRFLPTREQSARRPLWIRESDATVAARVEKLPWGVGEQDKWITLSITQGTLVAYEGWRPVFATLISPGAGGVPIRGKDPVKMSTTPLGAYRVTFKHAAQTMSPGAGLDERFWIADVPHTQYFNAPFALHTAYWHDDFGEPMSAGCVNLSPLDGLWLFRWTSPALPTGWGGVAPHRLTGVGTHVIVRR